LFKIADSLPAEWRLYYTTLIEHTREAPKINLRATLENKLVEINKMPSQAAMRNCTVTSGIMIKTAHVQKGWPEGSLSFGNSLHFAARKH